MSHYDATFYATNQEGSRRSAKEIVPLVVDLIKPTKVIDVGCGVATWLSVFRECGVEDVFGIDGDYVTRRTLQIPPERFMAFDLTQPVRIDRQFDLVVSLEVAEHIPAASAATFVESLTGLGPAILFSAAVPFQGGTEHVNEQWPDYWMKHFRERGYEIIDCIRKHVWLNRNVEYWYAQNTFLFIREDCIDNYPLLKHARQSTDLAHLSIVHPRLYLRKSGLLDYYKHLSLRRSLSLVPGALKTAMANKVKKYVSILVGAKEGGVGLANRNTKDTFP